MNTSSHCAATCSDPPALGGHKWLASPTPISPAHVLVQQG